MLKTEMEKKTPKGQNQEASPEQDLLDIFVAQGMKIVMQIAPKLKSNASIDALGNALYNIVNKIETEGAKNGVNFPQWVLIRGVKDILIFLLDTVKVQVDEMSVKSIIGIAVGQYMDNALKTGKMTKEQAAEIAKQMQQNPGIKGVQSPQPAGPVAQPNPQMPMQSGAGGMPNG